MKKLLSILLMALCTCLIFAATFTPYIGTIDLDSAILSGWCPTYAGVGGKLKFPVSNGDVFVLDLSVEGGLTERALFQAPDTGEYLLKNSESIGLIDTVAVKWKLKTSYNLGDKTRFTLGYNGIYEKRQDSLLSTGKYWPKSSETKRWLGKSEKEEVIKLNDWLNGKETTAYPELSNESSVFTTFFSEFNYNAMIDTAVANDGYIVNARIEYAPELLQAKKDANFFSSEASFIFAKQFIDIRSGKNLNLFAVSFIDRVLVNYTYGSKIPTSFQQFNSMGNKVHGFNSGSYASEFFAVNNFELRLSSPEPIKGIFLRTNIFFDFGVGYGRLFNSDLKLEIPTILASAGVQEQIDFFDAFDLGIEVAYLIHGQNSRNPDNKVQVGATFTLPF